MKKIGLTLGGGGARGAAHIGVLMELDRLGFQPDLITGTSIGGLIGALKAADVPSDKMRQIIAEFSLAHLFSLPGGLPAFSSNVKMRKLLEGMLGARTFAELKTPLAVVATDLAERHEVVLDGGDLITAVMATAALPLVLPPVEHNGHMLVDGGLLNNVPFDVARARGCTAVLAVDLMNTAPYGTPTEPPPTASGMLGKVLNRTQQAGTWQVLSSVMDIVTTQSMNARMAISRPDVLLRPFLGTIGLLDFHRWEEGIKAGQTAVRENESAIQDLLTG